MIDKFLYDFVEFNYSKLNSLLICLILSISYVGCLYINADRNKRYI